jgi:hypothetical protein
MKYAANDDSIRRRIRTGFVVYFELTRVKRSIINEVSPTARDARNPIFFKVTG